MPVIEALAPEAVKMHFFEPPVEDVESHRIYERGVAIAREGIVVDGIPQSPKQEKITVNIAREHSFGFQAIWGRRAGTSTVVACLSNWLAGFDATDAEQQRACTLDIIARITGGKVEPKKYGDHKYVAYITTTDDAQTMVRRGLDTQDQAISTFFPRYAEAQAELTAIRYGYLVNPDGTGPFGDIFEGDADPLTRPMGNGENPEDKYFYKWGYQEEEGKLYAISPGFTKYSLSMMIANSPLEETAQMLTELKEFLEGESDENRFAFQIDWDEDATCSNTAINSHEDAARLTLSVTEVMREAESILTKRTILAEPHIFGGGGSSREISNYCKTCKEKNDECICEQQKQSLAA